MEFHLSKIKLQHFLVFFSIKISHILAALQSGSRGTQACINAGTTIKGIVSDLDTTVMFATAGTLNPEEDGEKFTDHRYSIV